MRLHDLINESVDKDEIKNLMTEYFEIKGLINKSSSGYTIDEDGIVNVINMDKFSSIECKLIKYTTKLPVKFGIIVGQFVCGRSQLETLEGSPHTVKGNFHCFSNKLVNLIGGPNEVDGEYNCYLNPITSLDGLPEKAIGFRIGYQPNLPLLKILTIKNLRSIRLLSNGHDTGSVEDIMNKYIGKGKVGIIQCAAELTRIGCKENAKL